MTGKGHLVSGTVAAADAIAALYFCRDGGAPAVLVSASDAVISAALGSAGAWWHTAAGAAVLAAGYYIGLLLPDIDKENSMIARRLHVCLAVNHRGITHSVWALAVPAVLSLLSIWPLDVLCRGLFLGMLAHCLVDAMSVAGWVPFYPLGKWRTYNHTVMTRRRGHFGLYSSAREGSEGVVNGLFVIFSAGLFGFWAYLLYWPK